jgi:taurine dioxygenase
MGEKGRIKLRPLSDALGAEVTAIDAASLDDATFKHLLDAFHDNIVLVLRDQALSPRQQVEFSRRLGELEHHVSAAYQMKGEPDVMILSNEVADGKLVGNPDAGSDWHSDQSYTDRPCAYTILQSVHIPERGGDTAWTNMVTAYEALSDSMKARIAGLVGVHNFSRLKNPRMAPLERLSKDYYQKYSPPDAYHPLVRTHPFTNKKALYLSPRSTIGIKDMDDAEAQPLLDELFAHIDDSRFVYRHKWRRGDLVMWDNRACNHIALGGVKEPEIRRIHRTTVMGEIPF